MSKKDITEKLTSEKTEWQKLSPDDIFKEKDFLDFLEKSRSQPEDRRIYASINIESLDEATTIKLEAVLQRLINKDKSLKKISANMKKALERKNRKLKKMLKYISILEKMLEKNNIDYVSLKEKIRDNEIALVSRKPEEHVEISNQELEEYTDAIEIELDEEGNELDDE